VYTTQPSEIVILVMAVFLTPVMYATLSTVEFAGKRAFYLMYGLIFLSYIGTVAEGFVLGAFFNFVEHGSIAAAGLAAAIGMSQLLADLRAQKTGGSR
jgi:hypothetical protein